MRNEALRDVLKIWLYAASLLLIGAAIVPYLYNFGMALAEITADRRTIGFMERRGAGFRGWEFSDYLRTGFILSSILLFPLFAAWLRLGNGPPHLRGKPWSLRLPETLLLPDHGQPLRKNPSGLFQWATGFLLITGLLLMVGWALARSGSFQWAGSPPGLAGFAGTLLLSAIFFSLLQEILFRGIALGIFLRAMPPAAALAVCALLFALLHFFFHPSAPAVPDPEAHSAGFQQLGAEAARLADPFTSIPQFLPLLAAGFLFSYARWRTASLWLPAGLHAGWIFANGLFPAFASPVPRTDPIACLLAGELLQHGFIPLTAVALASVLAHFLTASHGKPAETA